MDLFTFTKEELQESFIFEFSLNLLDYKFFYGGLWRMSKSKNPT